MVPAFSSTRQTAAFVILMFVVLLSPVIIRKSMMPTRDQIYLGTTWKDGPYPYLHRQIFEETADIDIAFVGSSHIWTGLSPLHVQDQLSRDLGRPAVVQTFGWPWAGYDTLYYTARDLLEHRKIRMLVFYDDCARAPGGEVLDDPQRLAPHWFRWSDAGDEIDGLPLRSKLSLYYAAILGMPRSVLGMVRKNSPDDPFEGAQNYWERRYVAPSLGTTLGALCARLGVDHDAHAYEEFQPTPIATAADALVYSPETAGTFKFVGPPTPPASLHFAKQFAKLAAQHGARLVMINFPYLTESRSSTIAEREFWPEVLGDDIAMVGIPPATLFAGLSDQDVRKLFYENGHFNINGQTYFTSLMTPCLLKLYHECAAD